MVRRFFWAFTARLTRATVVTPHQGPARWFGPAVVFFVVPSSSAAQELLDPPDVDLVQADETGQPAGAPGGLALQLVALAGLFGNDLAASGDPDPLPHPGVALHLRHRWNCSPSRPRWPAPSPTG